MAGKRFKIYINVLHLSRTMMISAIVLIVAFQCYWINKLYHDQWNNVKRETDVIFRDVLYKQQLQRFRSDTGSLRYKIPDNLFIFDLLDSVRENLAESSLVKKYGPGKRKISISVLSVNRNDSVSGNEEFISNQFDSLRLAAPPTGNKRLFTYYNKDKTITDTLSLRKLDSAYKSELIKNSITLSYRLNKYEGKDSFPFLKVNQGELKTDPAFTGLTKKYAYQATFDNPFSFIIGKIKFPLLVSFLLILITTLSFVFLYNISVRQRRLVEIKNEFISNITHELKTPIATVNVAIEALRNFNALQNPGKTKEYLDISASELQRLSLLVDKVLRLSMFENKEIELNKEQFDLKELINEVIATMRLQFDKGKASVHFTAEGGSFLIEADKLHIMSVIYNLLDNALKYGGENPVINIQLSLFKNDILELKVSDNGIGIAPEYHRKIFDKFFRVPTGDKHNIKGYGLGLSYVSEIIHRHMGFIYVESELGKGSTFIVKIPVKEAPVIYFDEHRSIRKKERL